MLGLALEGGGAKGSFQAGLMRALLDHGYVFDGAVGSSIGALNAAMLVQGDFEKSYEIWNNMEFSKLFDFEDEYAEKIAKMELDRETVKYFLVKLGEAIKNRGLDTTKIKKLIDYYIDEEKIRNSSMDYGLMTVSLEGKSKEIIKPYPLFKEDIPYGKIADYIMASANFPGFKRHTIDDKAYRDGGLYDNLPINMLIDKGYDDIIAVHLRGFFSPKKKPKDKNVNIKYIIPSEKPGRMLDFNNASVSRGLTMGYFDGMRFIKGYIGKLYYIDDIRDYKVFDDKLLSLSDEFFIEMSGVLGVNYYPNKLVNMFDIYAKLNKLLEIKEPSSIGETVMELLERFAMESSLERLRMYTMKEFTDSAYDAFVNSEHNKKGGSNKKRTQLESAFLTITKYYK